MAADYVDRVSHPGSGEANFEKRSKTRHKPQREKVSVPLSTSRGKLILRKGVKQDISLGERKLVSSSGRCPSQAASGRCLVNRSASGRYPVAYTRLIFTALGQVRNQLVLIKCLEFVVFQTTNLGNDLVCGHGSCGSRRVRSRSLKWEKKKRDMYSRGR